MSAPPRQKFFAVFFAVIMVTSMVPSTALAQDTSAGNSSAPTVNTNDATDTQEYLATINGEVSDLGSADQVEVYFKFRKNGTDEWRQTDEQTLNESGEFDERLEFLDPGTTYDFRVVAEGDGNDTGNIEQFSTSDNLYEFIQPQDDQDFRVWAGALFEPRVETLPSGTENGMTTQVPLSSVAISSQGEPSLDKTDVSVYDPGQEITVSYGGGFSPNDLFNDSEVDLVAVQTDLSGDDDLSQLTQFEALLENEDNTAEFVERNVSLNEGAYDFTFEANESGSYAFLVMNSGSVEIEDGNVSEFDDARAVGADVAIVQDGSSTVTPAISDSPYPQAEYRPGDNVTLDVEADLEETRGNITHAAILYDENELGGQEITVNVGDIENVSLDNISSETSIKRIEGSRETDGDAEIMGQSLGERSEDGAIFSVADVFDFVGGGIGEDLAPEEGDVVLNASLVAESGTDAETTLEVDTLENFSTGEYSVIHVAENNETGELYTNKETVELTNDPDPYLDVDIDEEDSKTQIISGEEAFVVNATVTNVGGGTADDTVSLYVDDEQAVNDTAPSYLQEEGLSESVSLDGTESQSISFEFKTYNETRTIDGLDATDYYTPNITDRDSVEAELRTETGTDSVTINLADEDANVDVEINEETSETEVPVGEPLVVNATLTNTGGLEATQDITASLENGDVSETVTQEVTIDGNAETSVELEIPTSGRESGDYTVTVGSDDDSDTANATILPGPAKFNVTLDPTATDTGIAKGENLSVVVDVSNDGGVADTQDIEVVLRNQSSFAIEENVSLDGGDSTSVDFTLTTDGVDTGNYTVDAFSIDEGSVTDEDTLDVRIFEAAAFSVDNLQPADKTVNANESFDVSANVTNVGGVSAEQTVELRLEPNGDAVETQSIEVADGETETVTFEDVAIDESGEYNHTIASEDSSSTGSLTVLGPESNIVYGDLSVEPNEVTTGEQITIDANVTNFDNIEREFNATVFVDGEQIETETDPADTLAAGEARPLSFTTSFDTEGIRAITVGDADLDGAVQPEPQFVGVDLTSRQLNVTANETTIEEGETVLFNVTTDGDPVNASLEVNGQEYSTDDGTATVTFDEAGDYEATVTKPDTESVTYPEDSVNVRVDAPANIEVTDVSPLRTQLYTSDTLTVEADVENLGDLSGSEEVTFEFNDTEKSQNVTLDGGETDTLVFTAEASNVGEFPVTVEGDEYQTITVDPALATTDFSAPSSVTVDEDLVVTAEVENRGTEEQSKTVDLSVDGEVVDSRDVTVDGSSSETVELTSGITGPAFESRNVSVDDLDPVAVDVEPRGVGLDIASNATSETVVGDTVEFTVEDEDGNRVEDATVRVDGEFTTGDDGVVTTTFDESDRYTARASKADTENETFERASTSVRVRQPANVTVTEAFLGTDEAVVGDDVEVFAAVENDGGVEGEIELAVTNGTDDTLETRNVTLGAGESTTVTVTTQFDATGDDETISVNGEEAGTVGIEPQSVVTDASLDSTAITPGDTVAVEATVENRGETDDEDGIPVTFTAGDRDESAPVESIPAGETVTVVETFTFGEDLADDTYDVTAGGPTQEVDAGTVTVAPEVTDLELSVNGETESVTVTDGTPLEFTVERADDEDLDDATITIADEEYPVEDGTASVTLEEGGEYTAVATKDDGDGTVFNSDSVDVTVQEEAAIEVTDAYRQTTQAFTGDNVTIEADVENDGDLTGNETITLTDENDTPLDNQTVELDGGNDTTVTLTTTFDSAGTSTLSVDDEEAGEVEIDEQTAVTDFTVDDTTVTVGDDVTVNATVENRGSTADDEFEVTLYEDGEAVDSTTVSDLEADGVTSVEFTRTLDDVGRINVSVNDEPSTSVLATERIAELSIETDTENPTTEDDVTFTVTDDSTDTNEPVNDATITASGQVLTTDENGQANASFSSGTVSASVTKDGDQTTYDSDSTAFTVNRPANVRILDTDVTTDEPVYAGQTVDVEVDLLNTGGVEGDRDVSLTTDDGTVTSSVESVSDRSSRTVTLSVQLNGTGDRTLSVTHNETDTVEDSEVSVEPAATLTDYTVNETAISTNDSVRVQANVENRGGIDDSTDVELLIDGDADERDDVAVDPGASTVSTGAGETNATNFTVTFESNETRTVAINDLDPTEISIARQQVSLDLTAEPTNVTSGETIEFTVEDEDGDSVEGATVAVGDQRVSTDVFGEAEAAVRASGNYTAVATRSGDDEVAYERDTVGVTVEDPLTVTDSRDFGNVSADPDGENAETIEVEIENDGGRSVSLGRASISGPDSSQFEVRDAPSSIPAGGDAVIVVAYAPSERGDASGNLTFRADTPQKPTRTVELSGTGVAPGISLNRTDIEFGEKDLGSNTTETVEIENTGNSDLRITTEPTGDGFSRTKTGTIEVAPGDTKTIGVTFEPDEAETYGSQLRLSSNDPFDETVAVGASGTGSGGELLLSPSGEYSFGEVTQGSTETASVLVENTGTDSLTVTPTEDDDANDEFDVESEGEDISLGPGESEFVTVDVTPGQTDSSSTANVTFDTNDADIENGTLDLTATRLSPTAEVTDPDDANLTFDDVAVGGSTTEAVEIENTGEAELEVDTTDADLSDSPFELVGSPGTVTVQPDETREISVRFAPSSPGDRTADLTLDTTDPENETIELGLSGIAEETSLEGSPGTIEYETIGEDDSSARTVTLANDGTEELTNLRVNSKSGSGAGQFAVDSETVPGSLAAGEETDVTIEFAPTEDGSHSASVKFAATGDLDGSSSFSVSLSGEATPPDVAVNESDLEFGYVNTVEDEDATETVAIDNDGLAGTNLTVEDVSVTDDDTDAFSVADAPDDGTDVAGGESETVAVDFDPDDAGEQTATLEIETNDPDEDIVEISLAGVGSAPDAAVDPDTIGFGQVPVDETSDSETVEITNDGGETLDVDDLTFEGSDAGQFTVTDGLDDDESDIVPGASRTVSVAAAPTTEGELTANLTVQSNENGETSVALTANGTAPNLTVTDDLNGTFGDVRTGSSERRSITVSNDGEAPLEIDSPSINGSDAFTVVSGGSTTLDPDESETYDVAFSPDEPTDDFEGTFELTSNGGDHEVALTGTGVEADASLSPSTYDFGDVPIETTAEETFTFENEGNASLEIESVSLVGEDASVFSTSGLSPGTIDAEDSEAFTVDVSPSVTGSVSAQVEIETAEAGTTTATLGATGVEQDVELGTNSLTFDRTRLGTTTTETITVSNDGNAPLNVSDLALSGADSDQFEVTEPDVSDDSPLTIEPGESREVTVEFAPPTDDVDEAKNGTAQTATVLVRSDDPDEGTVEVDLSGTGKTPELRVSSDALRFGSTSIDDTSTRELTVTNDVSATADANIRTVAASGGIGNEFTVTDAGDEVLEPGESTTVTVELTPQVPGPKFGSLNVITGDPRQPGKSVFLSNSETIVTVAYGSVDLSYENVNAGLQPDRSFSPYPDADAEVTGTQPYVETNGDFNLSIDGSPDAFGAEVSSDEYEAVRYVSATKENVSSSALENNTFTFRVSKAALDDLGASEDDVRMLRYDGSSYEPVSGGTELESEERTDYTYEATTDSLSQFAIVVDKPQSNLNVVTDSGSLSSDSVRVDNEVTATVNVENTGDADGEQDYELTLDGETVTTETASVGAGDTTEVEFTFTPSETGDFDVAVGGASVGTLAVTDPQSDLGVVAGSGSLSSDSVRVNNEVTATVDVDNVGDADGTERFDLTLDGETVTNETASVDAGNETEVEFTFTPTDTGDFDVAVAGTSIGELSVRSRSGGGGGGGGGSVTTPTTPEPPEPPENVDVTGSETVTPVLDPGTNQQVAEFEAAANVRKVTFQTDQDVGDVRVSDIDPDTTDSPGSAVAVQDISPPDASADTPATIEFTVPRDRLDAIEASPEELRVFRGVDDGQEPLETSVEDAGGDAITVTAETPGFSVFSVSAVSEPDAAISVDADAVETGDDVTLSGADSETEYGEIVSYDWSVAGETLTGEDVRTAFDESGEYTVELTVTNDAGETDTATADVVVETVDDGTADDTADDGATDDDTVDDDTADDEAPDDAVEEPGGIDPAVIAVILVLALIAVTAAALARREQ